MRPAGGDLAEVLLQAHQLRAITEKPVLEALCEDIREVANQLPVGTERRLVLLDVLVRFSATLHDSGAKDISPAAADAFRNDHSIPKRCA